MIEMPYVAIYKDGKIQYIGIYLFTGKEEKEKVDKHGKVDDEVEMSDINKLDEEAEDSSSEQITDIQVQY